VTSPRGPAATDELAGAVRARATGDGRIATADVADLVDRFGLASEDPVLCAALPLASELADPPISAYRVGAVGLEAPTGDLLLGGNLEFPGGDLGHTLHAEGVVAVRTFLRGTILARLAIGTARPCAHCRQTLVEFAWADALRIIDPHGHERTMADLYPWPFVPADLGEPGAVPGAVAWPHLRLDDGVMPGDIAAMLVGAGGRAHAPYSRCPAAVVLRLHDGRLVPGWTFESVAFNPTIGPLGVAIVALRSGGDGYADIESAWLAAPAVGPVDDAGVTRHLLAAIAPQAHLKTTNWADFDRT
jgi:cytidine deaminase